MSDMYGGGFPYRPQMVHRDSPECVPCHTCTKQTTPFVWHFYLPKGRSNDLAGARMCTHGFDLYYARRYCSTDCIETDLPEVEAIIDAVQVELALDEDSATTQS